MTEDSLSRRRALALSGLAIATPLAGCGSADDGVVGTDPTGDGGSTPIGGSDGETATDGEITGPDDTETDGTGTASFDDLTVRAEQIASGFTSPVAVEVPEPGRRFVVDQTGQIRLHDGEGLRDEPFLDVTDRMVDLGDGYSERGLLGLAFHPSFAENGRLFVRYSAPPRADTPDGYSHTFVLSEFRADPEGTTADPDSETAILEIPQPQGNHNAGAVTFGPDGYLYVGTGDGGGANDQGDGHVEDWYDAVGGGNGQDVTENLLGSVLRIDVDGEQSETTADGATDGGGEGRNYAIPADNPLVGEEGRDEQYAWGFRNPWRLSFGPEGRLFVADVGQSQWEEVDVVERGGNYGWNVREGAHCFQADDCPEESPRGRELRDPVIEYPHGGAEVSGIAVIGGYLYDGDAMPALRSRYLFADWRAQGRLFAARETDGLWETTAVEVESEAQFGPNVLSFGRTPAGELLVCTTAEGGLAGDTGAVFRLRGA